MYALQVTIQFKFICFKTQVYCAMLFPVGHCSISSTLCVICYCHFNRGSMGSSSYLKYQSLSLFFICYIFLFRYWIDCHVRACYWLLLFSTVPFPKPFLLFPRFLWDLQGAVAGGSIEQMERFVARRNFQLKPKEYSMNAIFDFVHHAHIFLHVSCLSPGHRMRVYFTYQ